MNRSASAAPSGLRKNFDGSMRLIIKEPWAPTAKPWVAPPDEEFISFEGSFCPRMLQPYTKASGAKYMAPNMRPPAQPSAFSLSSPALLLSVDPDTPLESIPLRKQVENPQADWGGELFVRSLRCRGLKMTSPVLQRIGMGAPCVKQFHESWKKNPQTDTFGFTGKTIGKRDAAQRPHNKDDWIDRRVAVGRLALTHHGGTRYAFPHEPRGEMSVQTAGFNARPLRA